MEQAVNLRSVSDKYLSPSFEEVLGAEDLCLLIRCMIGGHRLIVSLHHQRSLAVEVKAIHDAGFRLAALLRLSLNIVVG